MPGITAKEAGALDIATDIAKQVLNMKIGEEIIFTFKSQEGTEDFKIKRIGV